MANKRTYDLEPATDGEIDAALRPFIERFVRKEKPGASSRVVDMQAFSFGAAQLSRAAAAAALALFVGCASLLPAPVPMHSVRSAAGPKQGRCLMVLLPGFGDSDVDFDKHGFIAELRSRKLSVDTVSANAKIGYYARGMLADRIDADILAPNTAGYEQVWITGVSMGGMGTLLTGQRHPEIAGLVLIAPFLGDSDLITEITVAGGLGKWKAPAKPAVQNGDNYQRDIWRWLQLEVAKGAAARPIYILSGDQDPGMRAHRLLASNLPAERVFRVKGDHDWGPWKRLWADFLDRSDFSTRCAAR